ncbi:NmrA family NAD(P)-binding protein [Dactylosporangium sp. NBC_01737]|uniref:SDR family oxidoreductase n=1 Tax=Dactylosporangium sp. NBC_01737 TaxID=2975959 RepID=UPI002E1038A8|nr:NmrA family NAD(P)-binding protein [Dactylosporangium sp. NBC_01737]
MTVLVAGATGSIGKEVTAALLARGAAVRALVRSHGRAALLPAGAEPVVGDLRNAASVAAALHGVTAALYVSPHDADEELMAEHFVAACERLGVRLVFAGVAMTGQNPVVRWCIQAMVSTFLPHYKGKLRIARRVATAGRTRPVVFSVANYYQNDELVRDEILGGQYPLPAHRAGINRIDLRDVGEVVARAMTDPGFPSGAHGLVGPASISGAGSARIWADVLGRPVRYTGDRLDWQDLLADRLHGAKLADYRRSYGFLAKHGLPTPARELAATAALLGRPPRAYETYVRDMAERWCAPRRS